MPTPSQEDKELTFKSPLINITDQIILGTFGVLLILNFLFFSFTGPIILFIDLILFFIIFYGIRAWCRCETKISIADGYLSINQDSVALNKTQYVSIPIEQIRGYEISEVSRGTNALLIYNQENDYYKYSLMSVKDHLPIDAFLAGYISKLTAKSNPNFNTFGAAFLFALKRWGIFSIISLSLTAFVYYLNTKYLFWPDWLFYTLIFLCNVASWWFIIRKALKEKMFRFGAYYWLFNILSYCITFMIAPYTYKSFKRTYERPFEVSSVLDIHKNLPKSIYIIKNISYSPEKYLFSNYHIGRRNRKTNRYPISHHIISPIGEGDAINPQRFYTYWLLLTHKQSVTKGPLFYDKINLFNESAKEKTRNLLQNKPLFYTIAEQNKGLSPLLRSNRMAAPWVLMLVPHWESVASYKRGERLQTGLILLAFLSLGLIGCLSAAEKR